MVVIVSFIASITVRVIYEVDEYTSEKLMMIYQSFMLQYLIQFFLITVLLAVSTFASISQMRRVFGEGDEEKIIKLTLGTFCISYILRVIFDSLSYSRPNVLTEVYEERIPLYAGLSYGLWVIWDFIPMLSMLIIHYKNFSSFSEEEDYLYTEYSVDDPRTTTYSHVQFTNRDTDMVLRSSEMRQHGNALESSGINFGDTTIKETNSVQEGSEQEFSYQ